MMLQTKSNFAYKSRFAMNPWQVVRLCSMALAATATVGLVASNFEWLSWQIQDAMENGESDEAFLAGGADARQLMRSLDRRSGCFEEKNKRNYYARNPWNTDKLERKELGDRGDWAKCLPSPSFAVMCIHAQAHGLNPEPLQRQPTEDGTSEKWRFQMHDWHSGILYETLLGLHEKHCAHVELEMTSNAKNAFDDYIMGTGDYAWHLDHADPEPEPEPEPLLSTTAEPEPEPVSSATTTGQATAPVARPPSFGQDAPTAPASRPPSFGQDSPTAPALGTQDSATAAVAPASQVSSAAAAEGEKSAPEFPPSTTEAGKSTSEPEPEPEPNPVGVPFTQCDGVDFSAIPSKRARLRKSLFCAFADVPKQEFQETADLGRSACADIFNLQESDMRRMTICPEDGGRSCGMQPFRAESGRRRRGADSMTCDEFCGNHGRVCSAAALTHHRQCQAVRSWGCGMPNPNMRRRSQHLKCSCLAETRTFDSKIHARPLMVPSPTSESTCRAIGYQKVSLYVDVVENSVVVNKREQTPESRGDFNDIGGYELCDGVELTPPESSAHCSTGNRIGNSPEKPCMMRLEQLTYTEASAACRARGGHLATISSVDDVRALRDFSDKRDLGVGIRDHGAEEWYFDNGTQAPKDIVEALQAKYGDEFKRTGCVRLSQRGTHLKSVSCEAKFDWICQGSTKNDLSSAQGVIAENDLKADEGSFCLWGLQEPVDYLPNDEGTNFRNTDLTCSLQTSSRTSTRCAYDPETNRLSRKRGDRDNAANYPVMGGAVGWKGEAANETFLSLKDADDYYHCHYSPSNSGLLRMFSVQHMFERNYPGALKRKCGCGYKFLSQLVSRCDCTRSGKADNGCARWHSTLLSRATKSNPVKCNNCNSQHNL